MFLKYSFIIQFFNPFQLTRSVASALKMVEGCSLPSVCVMCLYTRLSCPILLGFWTVKSNCFRTNMFTDITILCADNKHVTSHKLILGVTSQYFQDILYPPISSSLDSETVRIRDESLIFAFVIGWVIR